MAVTFGRLGTTRLNRGVNVTVTPEFKIIAPSGGGGGGDVTPNPTPNWGTVGYNDISSQWQYSQQQIQGIDTTITLQTNISGLIQNGTLWYAVSNTTIGISNVSPPGDAGFTQIANGGTFTVSNNQWVAFGGDYIAQGPSTQTVTVVNQSDGGATLDTFSLRMDF